MVTSTNALLTGLYLISTASEVEESEDEEECVNALSGLYLISTRNQNKFIEVHNDGCKCPLGLIPHF